jgi:hypothetical protein
MDVGVEPPWMGSRRVSQGTTASSAPLVKQSARLQARNLSSEMVGIGSTLPGHAVNPSMGAQHPPRADLPTIPLWAFRAMQSMLCKHGATPMRVMVPEGCSQSLIGHSVVALAHCSFLYCSPIWPSTFFFCSSYAISSLESGFFRSGFTSPGFSAKLQFFHLPFASRVGRTE